MKYEAQITQGHIIIRQILRLFKFYSMRFKRTNNHPAMAQQTPSTGTTIQNKSIQRNKRTDAVMSSCRLRVSADGAQAEAFKGTVSSAPCAGWLPRLLTL